nr:immunoglobulin light chain junction region [Macaca mulatta]
CLQALEFPPFTF